MLMGKQGAALLDFFRNLSPQVLFFACAIYYAVQLDFGHFSLAWDSLKLTLAFGACVVLWMASTMANVSRLLDAFVSGSYALDRALEEIRQRDASLLRNLSSIATATWTHNRRGLFEAALVLVVVYAALVPVSIMAVQSAATILNALRSS
jgi:hypothetical protein